MKRLLALSFLCLLVGCDDRELAALRRVGDKALEKASNLAAQAKTKVPLALPDTPPAAAEPSTVEKVAKRLRWDRDLAQVAIDVKAEKDGLLLTGVVPSEEAKRRAIGIAESTTGVAKVVDQLSVKPKAE